MPTTDEILKKVESLNLDPKLREGVLVLVDDQSLPESERLVKIKKLLEDYAGQQEGEVQAILEEAVKKAEGEIQAAKTDYDTEMAAIEKEVDRITEETTQALGKAT